MNMQLTDKFIKIANQALSDEPAFVGVCTMFGVNVVYARNKLSASNTIHLDCLTTDELCELYAETLTAEADAQALAEIVEELECRTR